MNRNIALILGICLGLIIVGFVALKFYFHATPPSQIVACTLEAKICPDGSSVGRTGPKCAFAACPPIKVDPTWKIFTDPKQNVTFRYPENLGTTYVSTVDWPPKAAVSNDSFVCTPAGNQNAMAGKTEMQIINNKQYCVTTESEGAAGSTYVNYAYSFPKNDGTAILTFSLKSVQCGNYPEPQMSQCQKEQSSFNVDPTIDKIAQTLIIKY